MGMCRAEKVRDIKGPLKQAVPVAVKVTHPRGIPDAAMNLCLSADHEALALKALNKIKALQSFITPLHLVHLPAPTQPSAPAYLVMG